MTARILHVADLHVGRRDADEPFAALRELAARLSPTLVVATGDLAHRGRASELERAAERLRALGLPVLAVPGNHDIPYTGALHVAVRQVGAHRRTSRARVRRRRALRRRSQLRTALATAGRRARRCHSREGARTPARRARGHAPRRGAPSSSRRAAWRAAGKRPLRRRGKVLRALVDAGVDLVLGGHVHQASVAVLPEFQAFDEADGAPVVLATASGFGRPRPHRQGEAEGLNVYDATTEMLMVTTFARSRDSFAQVGPRAFRRR